MFAEHQWLKVKIGTARETSLTVLYKTLVAASISIATFPVCYSVLQHLSKLARVTAKLRLAHEMDPLDKK